MNPLHLTECPRDALQGLHTFVPTDLKVKYLNALLRVGFHTLDFGSFVSPKAIPQMADTAQVLPRLNLAGTSTRLLAIVLNERGAADALLFPEVAVLGFPWSLSPTFQLRNGNQTPEQAWVVLSAIGELCQRNNRELLVYLSMGFGNPYGDPWEPALAEEAVQRIAQLGVRTFALADTVGAADAAVIEPLFKHLTHTFPTLEFGAHFHTSPATWQAKVQAAWNAGCRRFDTALGGYGGCPFAQDDLVGNLPTENLLAFLAEQAHPLPLNKEALAEAQRISQHIFST